MKKRTIIMQILILLILFPSLVLAKDTCNDNDIKIKAITLKKLNGFSEEVEESSINNNTINLNLKMYNVGDSSTYDITVENTSSEDYYFTKDSMKLENDYLEYSLKNDSEIIPAKNEKTIELKVSYKNQIPNDSYSDTSKLIISLSDKPLENPKTKMTYTFIFIIIILIAITGYTKINNKSFSKKKLFLIGTLLSIIPITTTALCTVNLNVETKIEIENKEAIFLPGKEVNVKMKELAGTDTSSSSSPYLIKDKNIIAIKYSSQEPIETEKQEKNIVSTATSSYPIYMWYEDGNIYWWSEDIHPNLNEDASQMFGEMIHLFDISSLEYFDSSSCVNLNGLFMDDSLANIESLKSWDISNVKQLAAVFYGNKMLISTKGINKWDTSKVVNLNQIFLGTSSLLSIEELRDWNVSNVKSMSGSFSEMKSLVSLKGLEYWDVSSVTTMNGLFYHDYSLDNIEALNNWNISNAKIIYGLFTTTKIKNVDALAKWNTSSATNLRSMFSNATNLENISGLKNWDVSNVTNFDYMFDGATSLNNTSSINDWSISPTANFNYMFRGSQTHPEFTKVQGTWNSEGTFTPTP